MLAMAAGDPDAFPRRDRSVPGGLHRLAHPCPPSSSRRSRVTPSGPASARSRRRPADRHRGRLVRDEGAVAGDGSRPRRHASPRRDRGTGPGARHLRHDPRHRRRQALRDQAGKRVVPTAELTTATAVCRRPAQGRAGSAARAQAPAADAADRSPADQLLAEAAAQQRLLSPGSSGLAAVAKPTRAGRARWSAGPGTPSRCHATHAPRRVPLADAADAADAAEADDRE